VVRHVVYSWYNITLCTVVYSCVQLCTAVYSRCNVVSGRFLQCLGEGPDPPGRCRQQPPAAGAARPNPSDPSGARGTRAHRHYTPALSVPTEVLHIKHGVGKSDGAMPSSRTGAAGPLRAAFLARLPVFIEQVRVRVCAGRVHIHIILYIYSYIYIAI
jgi:hypothetical protein